MSFWKSELVTNLVHKGKLPTVETDNTVKIEQASLFKVGVLAVSVVVVITIAIIVVKSIPKAT